MGITARGAWESVKRHFRELGTNIQEADFTVVGIGDMSGDVFGNGMLLSPHIKLARGVQPPCTCSSTRTRIRRRASPSATTVRAGALGMERLHPALISEGGGVYERTAKSIPISPRSSEALGIEADELAPDRS